MNFGRGLTVLSLLLTTEHRMSFSVYFPTILHVRNPRRSSTPQQVIYSLFYGVSRVFNSVSVASRVANHHLVSRFNIKMSLLA